MTRIADLPIAEFEAWLKANPELDFARSDACRCPIAKFAQFKLKDKELRVNSYALIHLSSDYQMLPAWAADYVTRFDFHYDTSAPNMNVHAVKSLEYIKHLYKSPGVITR